MFIILPSDDETIAKKVDIEDEAMEDLKTQYLNSIKKNITEFADFSLTNISVVNERLNTTYYYDFDNVPKELEIMKNLIVEEDRPNFNFNQDELNEIIAFVFLIGNEEHKVALYKKQYPISLIKRDSVFLFKVSERFVKLDDDILKLNDSFDFIQIGNELVILNLNTLERYFAFDSVIRNKATEILGFIDAAGIVSNIEPLELLSRDLKFAKKLMRVKTDSPVLQLPFNKVREFIKSHPKLKKRIRFTVDESKISLDTKTSQELFLKLLDDDFLKSELTQILYESEIKDELTNVVAED